MSKYIKCYRVWHKEASEVMIRGIWGYKTECGQELYGNTKDGDPVDAPTDNDPKCHGCERGVQMPEIVQ